MFILRRITQENKESNESLGENYYLIYKEKNNYDFNQILKILKWKDDEELYGFIYSPLRNLNIPLYKKSVYFIMCSDGKTFANITFK